MTSGKPQIKLFNTLTKSKDPFVPLDENNVRMYVCGPTVYDYAHIGNARPVIVFDVLFRLLRHVYGAEHVTYVRNITDVDDKINARAAERGISIRELTEQTNDQYQSDVKALGCLEPTHQPRATETIPEMIAMIQTLIDKKHAYAADGHVLFDVKSFTKNSEPQYGKLARRSLDDMLAGARVEVAPYKRDPMDFVLWKPSTPEEPGWDATFTISDENRDELKLDTNHVAIHGRPGWHIECSAMSEKYLWVLAKDTLSEKGLAHPHEFDIHGGGIDLSFPHHENELAQSCCAHDTKIMAQVWMHNGFLQVEGQKMSKSLGNFITIRELLETDKFGGRKWPGEVLRLAMLMTHYRDPIDFTVARLEEAEAAFSKWMQVLEDWLLASDRVGDESLESPLLASLDKTFDEDELIRGYLSDDLNTPMVISYLHGISADHANAKKQGKFIHKDNYWDLLGALNLLGVVNVTTVRRWRNRNKIAPDLELRVSARLAALAEKDYQKADAIRAELAEQGIQLMDYKDPETGERKTKWEVKR